MGPGSIKEVFKRYEGAGFDAVMGNGLILNGYTKTN